MSLLVIQQDRRLREIDTMLPPAIHQVVLLAETNTMRSQDTHPEVLLQAKSIRQTQDTPLETLLKEIGTMPHPVILLPVLLQKVNST